MYILIMYFIIFTLQTMLLLYPLILTNMEFIETVVSIVSIIKVYSIIGTHCLQMS